MKSQPSSKKVAAIYELREAAEAKAKAQIVVEHESTADARDALLDAQIELETKTADAVEACHDCDDDSHDHSGRGRTATANHPPAAGEASTPRDRSNVIDVDFRSGSRSA